MKTMCISPIHDAYDLTKIYIVKEEMIKLGPPKIRAVYDKDSDCYRAIEGSHRLAVAHSLTLLPEIIEVDWDDIIDNHDIYDLPTKCTVREIIAYVGNELPYDFSRPEDYII